MTMERQARATSPPGEPPIAGSKPFRSPSDDVQAAIDEFLDESARGLERIERGLGEAPLTDDHRLLVTDMFRIVHTLKGTSSLLGFSNIEATSHATETLIVQLRNGWRRLDPYARDALRTMCANIRAMLETIERARVPEAAPSPPSSLRAMSTLWRRLAPAARDLASRCGKAVRIETEGDHLIVDAVALDALRPTLVHLLRNAIDHGIERPDERQRLGKRPEGVIRLRGLVEAATLCLEVSDDGAGIDVQAVRSAAIDRGLLPRLQASDEEVLELLFTPGFTTVRELTPLSGRGVGLDIVKASVEALGGRVAIRSQLGRGTTVAMRIAAVAQ
jgi:chemotaxis protein histidine kinase CheA